MKISEQWLREWVNPRMTTTQLAEQLNLAGIEVASVSPIAGHFERVIVGQILEAKPHPNASRLQLCQVDIGAQAPLAIVCGASNARVGIKVAVAQIGAVLPNGITIKEVKLRGALSQGMLCSSQELGLSTPSEGILELPEDAPLGHDLRAYLQLDDQSLDIHLTPNRGDCLSIQGLAREVAALTEHPLTKPAMPIPAITMTDLYPVKVESEGDCPCYLGRLIRGIDPQAVTPRWISERLFRSGLRTIHPVVDVTNYVLLELGQPLHAFDLARLHGMITVRRAQQGETLTLLDGKTVTLDVKTLVIADEKQVQALAGIMGGQFSAVQETTTDLFLESAFFSPAIIAGRARHYGLQTESAYRFERGVDPQLARQGLERATQLILAIAGGQAGPVVMKSCSTTPPPWPSILLRARRVEKLLGIVLTSTQIENYLQRLGMPGQYLEQEVAWQVTPPSWRFDLKQEVDLIEELARLHGYEQIPATQPTAQLSFSPLSVQRRARDVLQSLLAARDYQEVITYSFVEPSWQAHFVEQNKALTLVNPISSDLSVMRASLWPGLVHTACYNQKRQQTRIRFFEIGTCFQWHAGQIQQVPHLGILASGTVLPEQWGSTKQATDFFTLKADVSALFAQLGLLDSIQFVIGEHPALHPGQTAQILCNGKNIGYIGRLHPQHQTQFDLAEPLYLVEIILDDWLNIPLPQFQSFSKYPKVRRDLSFWLDKGIAAAAIMQQAKLVAGPWLQDLYLFDVYENKKQDTLQRSFALALLWQHAERTLTDTEVDESFAKIIHSLQQQFAIQLREA